MSKDMFTTNDLKPLSKKETQNHLNKMLDKGIITKDKTGYIGVSETFLELAEDLFQNKEFHVRLNSSGTINTNVIDSESGELIPTPKLKIKEETDDEIFKFGIATVLLHRAFGINDEKELFHMAIICEKLFGSNLSHD